MTSAHDAFCQVGKHMSQAVDFLYELVTQGRKGERSNFKSQKHIISHKKIQNLKGFKFQDKWMTIQYDLWKDLSKWNELKGQLKEIYHPKKN